jgi:hypothetical protein
MSKREEESLEEGARRRRVAAAEMHPSLPRGDYLRRWSILSV